MICGGLDDGRDVIGYSLEVLKKNYRDISDTQYLNMDSRSTPACVNLYLDEKGEIYQLCAESLSAMFNRKFKVVETTTSFLWFFSKKHFHIAEE